MDLVEDLGLPVGHLDPLLRHDAQALLLEPGIDPAGQVATGRVGLDDGKGAFDSHCSVLGPVWKGKVAALYTSRSRPATAASPHRPSPRHPAPGRRILSVDRKSTRLNSS